MQVTQEEKTIYPTIGSRTFIAKTESGDIYLEDGSDGVYLVFDCDCLDALPYCRSRCCAMAGTYVFPEELATLNAIAATKSERIVTELEPGLGRGSDYLMRRNTDGFCSCLDRESKLCTIYESRPQTCQKFHCSKGTGRGWILAHRRYAEYER